MAESGVGGCCWCCFSFIFTVGLTALFMWLSLRTSKPSVSIKYFYLPALNKTLNDTKNQTLYISVVLNNGNKDKGINYDTINLTFTLPDSNISKQPVGNASVTMFRQGHKKKATKQVNVTGLNWTAISDWVYPNGSSHFWVDVATAVRFRILFWRTKRHRLMVGVDVMVNDSGQLGVLLNFLVFVLVNPW